MMPRTLTLIRHGESESNAVKRAAEKGTPHPKEKDVIAVHTSERRLTARGIKQAERAGVWMQAWLAGRPDTVERRFYMSPYARAMETAYYLGIEGEWRADVRICERNWGMFESLPFEERMTRFGEEFAKRKTEAFFWRPADGETMQDVFLRVRDLFTTLHRECSELDVVQVLHGETLWVFRFLLEYWLPEDLARMMLASENDWQNKIINCRIIQYTREREDGTLDKRLCRVRLIDPHHPADPKSNLPWQPISRRVFSRDALLAHVAKYPRFLWEDAA